MRQLFIPKDSSKRGRFIIAREGFIITNEISNKGRIDVIICLHPMKLLIISQPSMLGTDTFIMNPLSNRIGSSHLLL